MKTYYIVEQRDSYDGSIEYQAYERFHTGILGFFNWPIDGTKADSPSRCEERLNAKLSTAGFKARVVRTVHIDAEGGAA